MYGRKNEVTTAIFDLGNVLLRWDVEQILASLPFTAAVKEEFRTHIFLDPMWLDWDSGTISEAELVELISERSPLEKKRVEDALLTAKQSLTPFAESVAVLHELSRAGVPLFCLSNMPVEMYEYIKHYDFFELFDGIVISGRVGCIKPDPRIFHILLTRFNLAAECCLFIDDSLANIVQAQKIGLHTLHFKQSKPCYETIRATLLV